MLPYGNIILLKRCHMVPWEVLYNENKNWIIKKYISDSINNQIIDLEINADEIADTVAIKILSEIQDIIKNDDYSDFEIVERIVYMFEKYKIDFGNCHDF